MTKYHIGLDFGTNQSKVCVYHVENDIHEFFRFSNGTFFLPSRVGLKTDGKLEYGSDISGECNEEYHYFKIAAAEDPEFYTETFGNVANLDDSFYQFNEFRRFSPEFLSVVYLAYLLFEVKEHFIKAKNNPDIAEGVVERLLRRRQKEEEKEIRFTCQLGIPTEWSQIKYLLRRRKFENILLLSEMLQQKYGTKEKYLNLEASTIIEDIKEFQLQNQKNSKDVFLEKLHTYGLSVYPETAAGLTFIIKTGQIEPGYFAAMDIGAGSTDVSFFKVLANQTIRYFASESYIMAANNVYQKYADECRTIQQLKKAEIEIQEWLISPSKDNDEDQRINNVLREVNRNLQRLLKKLFSFRVLPYKNNIIERYDRQPIIMYGGGAQLPYLANDILMKYFDHGAPDNLDTAMFLEKTSISRYAAIINILPDDGSWQACFPMLVVALGLSYINPDNAADWFIGTEYLPYDVRPTQPMLVNHPYNEDRYIYDVLLSSWE